LTETGKQVIDLLAFFVFDSSTSILFGFVMRLVYLFSLLAIFFGCHPSENENHSDKKKNTLFVRIPASESGVNFRNELDQSGEFDVFRYRNYYNGGGVALGDINNDGLTDIYLISNTRKNKLFLNKGDLRFEDITTKARVGGEKSWSTGAAMADVNGDGLLDIYVCNSGNIKGDNKENELFINNGDLTFSERAAEFGLNDRGFSTQSVFFDYDKDGDLDMYLLNNSFRPVGTFGLKNIRNERDEAGGDKLYRNDNGKFKDVSQAAGIYGSVIGFGLGVSVSDVNNDQWPDIYVSNDFFERDYLYINNKNGAFSEVLSAHIGHTSLASMGNDIADINNDGWAEIFSTDMLPADDRRVKQTSTFESWDVYQSKLKNDYYHQYMRNMLQLNNRNGSFSEIGRLSGVSATDWTWGVLMADFDNDSFRDIYVTNGIYKDVTDQDFINFLSSDKTLQDAMQGKPIDFKKWIDRIPSTPISNFMFRNKGHLSFENVAADWGLDEPGFSNGAAYSDLDNDGDLDIVVNNLNNDASLYKNQSDTFFPNRRSLTISLRDSASMNTMAVGARIDLFLKGKQITHQHFPTRGFQSSVDYKVVIGIGDEPVDSIFITWPDGAQKRIGVDIASSKNASILLSESDGISSELNLRHNAATDLFAEKVNSDFRYQHSEKDFVDFDEEKMVYHMLSHEGPCLTKGDLNNDGKDDLFIGGASGQASAVYLSQGGRHVQLKSEQLEQDNIYEDVAALIFDANNDGINDIYVVTGSSEFSSRSSTLLDRLYLGRLKGKTLTFEHAVNAVPSITANGSCAVNADFDGDGDQDLFVGSRSVPGSYGVIPASYLLVNDKGIFRNGTSAVAPELEKVGLVTDAKWIDFDDDHDLDLMVVGEWMPITFFRNDSGKLQKVIPAELAKSNGFWQSIQSFDFNSDGKTDYLLGNVGLNGKFSASIEKPFSLIVHDFDKNRSIDQVYTIDVEGKQTPTALKHDLEKQLNFLKKRFIYYKDYAGRSVEEIFNEDELKGSTKLQVFTTASSVLINNGQGRFELRNLPTQAQVSLVRGFLIDDFNSDGVQDYLPYGNFSFNKPEIGRYDANPGFVFLSRKGKTEREVVASCINKFVDVNDAVKIMTDGKPHYVIGVNNNGIKTYTLK
jgi:enediyne biosynthesis protein E4